MNGENKGKLKSGCRTNSMRNQENAAAFAKDLFERQWEVFVVKKDESTGKLIGKVACCALAPV